CARARRTQPRHKLQLPAAARPHGAPPERCDVRQNTPFCQFGRARSNWRILRRAPKAATYRGSSMDPTPVAPARRAPPAKNIVETASSAGGLTTLVSGLRATGLADTLGGRGPYTIFAPTDDAFQ